MRPVPSAALPAPPCVSLTVLLRFHSTRRFSGSGICCPGTGARPVEKNILPAICTTTQTCVILGAISCRSVEVEEGSFLGITGRTCVQKQRNLASSMQLSSAPSFPLTVQQADRVQSSGTPAPQL